MRILLALAVILSASLQAAPNFIIVNGQKQFTGYRHNPRQYDRAQFRTFQAWSGATAGEDIPKELDLRTKCDIQIFRQRCGDCWWQATAGVMQDHLSCHDKKTVEVSKQWGIDCSGCGTCGGGSLCFKALKPPKGAVYASDYNAYSARTQRCNAAKKFSETVIDHGWIRSSSGGRPTLPDLQRAILETGGSVGVCGSARSLRSGGWVASNPGGGTDHCYRVVGWLDGALHGKPPGTYVIIANSWGVAWGDKGYGYYLVAADGVNMRGSVITEAAYINYKPACEPQPKADAGIEQNIIMAPGHSHVAEIGSEELKDTQYSWLPSDGIIAGNDKPIATVSPAKTTTYEVTAHTPCGEAKSKVVVHVFNKVVKSDGKVTLMEVK